MMKASFRLIFATLVATAALVACTKEITPNFENDKVNSEGSRVIAVSFGQQTKTTLDGFQPRFVDKDSILISNGEALDTCEVKVDGKGATITTNLTGPLTAVYPYTAAKMNETNKNQIDTVLVSTEQDGSFASANICMAKMTDENDESLSFENKTAVFKITPGAGESTQYVEVSADGFEIANCYQTGSAYTSFETIHVATTTADSVYVSILVPEGLKVGDLSFSDGSNVKNVTGNTTPIAAGTLYTVTNANWESTEADIPDGALKGVFSVSADKQVHFSQGNLYYDGSKFNFEANQYGFNSIYQSTYVSHFYWSKDVEEAVMQDFNGEQSMSAGDVFFTNADETTAKEGFTVNVNGKNQPGWRTLSTKEWQYLFNTRTVNGGQGAGKSYSLNITYGGKMGLVLYPDDYDKDPVTGTVTDLPDGVVFLPAASYRYSSDVDFVGVLGSYWSSSAGGGYNAYYVYFDSDDVCPDDFEDRLSGYSVRLVTDVSAAPTPTEPEYVEITMTVGGQEKTYKWAKCNLGAETETGYGDYYFWGTTVEAYTEVDYAKTTGAFTFKSDNPYGDIYKNNWTSASGFAWRNTPFTNGVYSGKNKKVFTKYVPEDKKSIYGYNDFYDNKTVLELEDDVANKVLGGTWRMPTKAEFEALRNLTKEWKANYNNSGVNGYLFTDKNNHSIFLPAAGCGHGTDLNGAGDRGRYWSSSLLTDNPSVAYCLGFNVDNADADNLYRYYGQSVRALSE